MSVEQFWKFHKPHLSEPSRKTYSSNTKKLFELLDEPFSDEGIINLVNKRFELFQVIGEYNNSTAKNYFNTMCELVKMAYIGKNKPQVVEDIVEHRNNASEKYRVGVEAHQYTEQQQKKVIDWIQVLAVRQELETQVKELHIRRKIQHDIELNENELSLFQDLVIVSLYTYIPPVRNDFAYVKIIDGRKYLSLTKEQRNEFNYLVTGNRFMRFHIHQFKTSKSHGEIVIDTPKPLKMLLRYWMRINPTDILLLNKSLEPLSENGITKYLTRIFEQYTGKKVSSTMLRHIYLSSEFGEEIRKELEGYAYKKDIADTMGHSVLTQKDYVKI